MSDTAEGPGWWRASDGQWYPPEAVPGPPTPPDQRTGGPTVVGQAGASAKERAAALRRDADNWESGGDGEARTAEQLDRLPSGYHVLHDLHVPGSTANIDHLVIGPSGAWLIDTKAYTAPLRYRDGTLWHGKFPMRKETEAVERYADAVSQVLHVPVQPALCFVDKVVPPEGRRLGRVHAVPLHDIDRLVTGRSGTPIQDVEGTARLARTLRTPTPAAGQQRGKSQPEPPPARRRGCLRSVLLLMVGIIAIAALGGIASALLSGAGKALEDLMPTTTTVAPPPLDGPTIEVPSPTIGIGIVCVQTGEGWQAGLQWPRQVDPAFTPVAYEVTSWTEGITVDPALWVDDANLPEPITGIAPNTPLNFVVQGILADGTRLALTPVSRTTPDRPC